MKIYLTALLAPFLVLLILLWVFVRTHYTTIGGTEYAISKAHIDAAAACDLGNLTVAGDSTVSADILPARISPGMRSFGYGGGTPIETYYIVRSFLKCPNRPKAVILSFSPSSLGEVPMFPEWEKNYFWIRAMPYDLVSFPDALEVLKYSERLRDPEILDTPSLFNIDYRVKAFLISTKFPAYFEPTLYVNFSLLRKGKLGDLEAIDAEVYAQTAADRGHHFYGTHADDGGLLDHDANREDDRIAPLADLYLRKTLDLLNKDGIPVFLVEPPRDATSYARYPADLIGIYQNYLLRVQATQPGVHLLGDGVGVWQPALFGDQWHLNLRGASIFSELLRRQLVAAGVPGTIADARTLQTRNLYPADSAPGGFWRLLSAPGSGDVAPVPSAGAPALAYPADGAMWLDRVRAASGQSATQIIAAPPVASQPAGYFAISVLIRNIDAQGAALSVAVPGRANATVSWDFTRRAASYSGAAEAVNSGVVLCPDGWVALYLSARSRGGETPGPVLSLSAAHDASAYLTDMTVERGLWPTNYCTLQPGEAKTVPLRAP